MFALISLTRVDYGSSPSRSPTLTGQTIYSRPVTTGLAYRIYLYKYNQLQ